MDENEEQNPTNEIESLNKDTLDPATLTDENLEDVSGGGCETFCVIN